MADGPIPENLDEKSPSENTHFQNMQTGGEQNHHETLTEDDKINNGTSAVDTGVNESLPRTNIDVMRNVLPELCEFAPLDFLLNQLPRKAQRSVMAPFAVEFTCLDVSKDFIVLGANFPMVFIYNRQENTITKLKCEDRSCRITCVKLLTSIDHQVAVGTSNGQVEVYLLPTDRPGQTFKEVRRFLIDGAHRHNVTCAEWSSNGMKLFTGDSVGQVVYSDIDFYENKCHTDVIHSEDMPIIQLNYAHKILIISTYNRVVLCYTDEQYRLQQVGQQPRKIKGQFGGHFVPALCKPIDATLCTTRPGLRIWHASMDGTVQETFKFKKLLAAQHQTIMLLPSTRPAIRDAADLQFGPVLFFNDCYVLTWSHNMLAVLDVRGPGDARIVASSLGDLGNIVGVATCGEEIYVLRKGKERPLIRIATAPEVFQVKEQPEAEHLKVPGVNGPHQPKSLGSPSTIKKTSFKNSLSTMRNLFHKAKEEIVDTTTKLIVTRLGKQDLDDCQSAGSSRRGSQEVIVGSPGGTPDATISPAILVAKLETTEDVDKESVPHGDRSPQGEPEPEPLPQPETQITSTEEPGVIFTAPPSDADVVNPATDSEPPAATLDEEKLLKIGQESFDDIVFRPGKQTKKKKKKSNKGSKKESPSHSPSPPRSKSASDADRNRTGRTKSDSLTLVPSSSEMDSHNMRSGSVSSQEKETRSESINSLRSEESRSLRSDSNQSYGQTHRTESFNRESEDQESPIPKDERSNNVKIENKGFDTQHTKSSVDTDHVDTGKVKTVAIKSTEYSEVPNGDVVLGGVIASSLDDVTTRIGTPFTYDSLNPSPREFPGTLRSWDDPTSSSALKEPHLFSGGSHMRATNSIHTLRSDTDSLKLDLKIVVPERSQKPVHFPESEQSPVSSENRNGCKVEANEASPSLERNKLDSTDDEIYTKYFAETPSSPPAVFVVEEAENRAIPELVVEPEELEEEEPLEDTPIPENIQQRFAGSWMQCSTPGYIMQLVVSDKHVWCVDNRDRVYHSLVSNVTIKWNKLKDHAMQMATSPTGNIVWRLHRKSGKAFACAPISPLSPIGTKWYEASKGVTHICLDESIAWVIKSNGEIFVHKGISRDRPMTREEHVDSNAYVLQIAANRGVVWAVGSNKKVLYRSEVSRTRPEGKKWLDLEDDEGPKLRFVSIALDSRNVGWGIDEDGLVWFRTGVTVSTPMGDDKKWWQVPMGEYLMQDPNALKMLLNMAGTNATVDRMTTWLKKQYYRATYIAASTASVWVCGSSHLKSSLQVSKGNLLGSCWENGCPVGLPTSAAWVSVSATGVFGPSGMIWAALKSGEVFCFPPDTRKPQQVDPPRAGVIFRHLSATSGTMWALQEDGDIYVRKQITARCPQGLSWKRLVLDQLGPCKIVHFSCGDEVVWACDNEGFIYLRIGVDIPHDESLPPAWIQVDGKATGYGALFTQVFCSVDNRLVWALDNKRTVYVRRGICEELPVGLEWEVVEGTQANHLCISSNTVWALCPNGDVACRFGITDKNCVGDYWKKVPGSYTYLSVSQSDDLWAINTEGKLYQRFTKMFHGRGAPQIEQLGSPIMGEDDWELL